MGKERKELGTRTIFNLIGPLANPAPIKGQLMGIFDGDLVNKIGEFGKSAKYISDFDDIANYIKGHACPHDLIITMGAGTVFEVGRKILN